MLYSICLIRLIDQEQARVHFWQRLEQISLEKQKN